MPGIHAVPYTVGDVVAGVVSLANDQVYGVTDAWWRLNANGFTYLNGTKGPTWITPQVGMTDYEISVTLGGTSDPLDVSAGLGVWISPSTNPRWGYLDSVAPMTGSLTVEIRRVSDGTVVDTATILLDTQGTVGGGDDGSDTGGGGGLPGYDPSDPRIPRQPSN